VAVVFATLPLTSAGAVQTALPTITNPDPADWTPNVLDGQVNAILQVGTKVIIGGTFTQVQRAGFSQIYTRNYLFAFDMYTGVIDPNFVPQLDREVEALVLAPDGTSVFVGGDFSKINGQTYRKLARLRIADGQPLAGFKANANSLVQDLVYRNGWLYVAGKFTQVKSVARSGLARLNPATGDVDPNLSLPFTDPLRGTLGVPKIDVSPDGTRLIAIGSFSQVAGLPRVQIAILNVGVTPATVDPWQTDQYPVLVSGTTTTWCSSSFGTYMRDIDISPDGQYFIVVSTGAFRAGRLCDTSSRWEMNTSGPGQQPTWVDWSGGDTSWSVSAAGTAIYVGGHFRWWNNPYRGDGAGPGSVAREGIVALDPINGLPFSWNPGHERGVGVFTLPATADGLWAGSDTDHAGGEFHQKIAFFPAAGGFAPPPITTYGLPNDLYDLDQNTGAMDRRLYDLNTFGSTSTVPLGIDWRNARGAFTLSGKLYYGWSDGTFQVRDFSGNTVGVASTINLNGLEVQPPSGFNIPGTTTRIPAFTTDLANLTGMFYADGRIYYTVDRPGTTQTNITNNNMLYYRYFTPESQVVGANLFVASTGGEGVTWRNVRGMTLASGKLIYATTDGRLWSVNWGGTRPTGPVTQISGPGVDARNWLTRGLFTFTQTTDTIAPSKPGTPTGSSSTFDSIDLSWAASTDNIPGPLTYRIYRDGNVVGQVTSSSGGTLAYHDGGLIAGTSHVYTVDALDGSSNPSTMSDASDAITVLSPDVTAPSTPGAPVGVSNSTSSIDLSWDASTDDRDASVTYRIFRDDPAQLVGQVISSSTTTVSFTDTALPIGSDHTYWIDAADASGNTSAPATGQAQVQTAAFADEFSTGGLANWNVTRISVDAAIGSPTAPSALGTPVAQSAFAYRDLSSTYQAGCLSVRVRAAAVGTESPDLFRLRTFGGGPIIKVSVNAAGALIIRSDVTNAQASSGVALGNGWHIIELCGTVDTAGVWDLYRDGIRIVNGWVADTGTAPIGRVQIGDTAAKTWTINFDEVILDAGPGGFLTDPDLAIDNDPPTVPGKPVTQSPSSGSVSLSWSPSSDDSPPIMYRVYRDGGPIAIGSTTATTFVDTGLTPGSSHTYALDATDADGRVSAISPSSDPIVVSSTIFADGFASGGFSNWTAATRLTIDPTNGSPTAPSAVGNPTALSAFAYRDLASTYPSACLSVRVNAASLGGNAVDLFRFRTAANGAVSRVYVSATGILFARSDVSGAQQSSNVALGTGWHTIELCGTVGTAGTWSLYRDGVRIVNAWVADTGTLPLGRIQIGDNAAKTWAINFDDIVLDLNPG
jgi:hypothetical protein